MASIKTRNDSSIDLSRLEFHRGGYGLSLDPKDGDPGIAILVEDDKGGALQRSCTCKIASHRTCPHIKQLVKLYKSIAKDLGPDTLDQRFRNSHFYKLFSFLAGEEKDAAASVELKHVETENRRFIRVYDGNSQKLAEFYAEGEHQIRFIERLHPTQNRLNPTRADVLDILLRRTRSAMEWRMIEMGARTKRQIFEESFWYRLAYHAFREFDDGSIDLQPAIDPQTGDFTIQARQPQDEIMFRVVVPRDKVASFLFNCRDQLPNQHGLPIHPIPLQSLFKVSEKTELDLIEIVPQIRLMQKDGQARFFDREGLEKYRYGNLLYIPEMQVMAELESDDGLPRKFRSPVRMVLKKSQVPSLIEELKQDQAAQPVFEKVVGLDIVDNFECIEIDPKALDRDWCWISLRYGFGNLNISLADILLARKKGERFLSAGGKWVDCQSKDIEPFSKLVERHSLEELQQDSKGFRVSRLELLKLATSGIQMIPVGDDRQINQTVQRLLHFKSAEPLKDLKGMTTTLRPYQKLGVEWLLFLYENQFGGLLCDDMGLGKTHQVLTLMLSLREHYEQRAPFLVVVPATVISHWEKLVQTFYPGLTLKLFYGTERDLEKTIAESDIILTSYGILRKDIDQLQHQSFLLSVFDEIQTLKNSETQTHRAAARITAQMHIGLTGTPIENRLSELWSLFNITLPGYLGSAVDFQKNYISFIEESRDEGVQDRLKRVIAPFTLRRKKDRVLDELPRKIEDIRSCELSEDQTKLYKDIITSRGKELIPTLLDEKKKVPYIHIFAVLNLLKQICDHPALLDDIPDNYSRYISGKWELFQDLLQQSLESDLKVVVYSQYINMIRIIDLYLNENGVDHVCLTGKTSNRKEVIRRFDQDINCRVFVGSLKAGGIGIDLVSASVVIHYDRWWNAAKEDQATDRVHRIGQTRGVQVFKLVTEGTLEEKISAIIEKKRDLMDSVIAEDDPELLKTFTRKELIELLADTSGGSIMDHFK